MESNYSIRCSVLLWICLAFSDSAYSQLMSRTDLYVKFKDDYVVDWNQRSSKIPVNRIPLKMDFDGGRVTVKNSFRYSEYPNLRRVLRMSFETEALKTQFIENNKNSLFIEYIEPVWYYRAEVIIPNDDSYPLQWHLPQIAAPFAWELSRANTSVVVAIVDDAVQTNHPDLTIVHQWDVSDDDANANPPNNFFNHGTPVAGCACAISDNAIGVASIGFNCGIMAIKASDGTPYLINGVQTGVYITEGYEGISYAANMGADIINCSWGGGAYSATEQMVINDAWAAGAIIVASAGNNTSSMPHYPSGYDNVVSVAALDRDDVLAWFSNFGNQIDVSAPGVGILTTRIGSNYTIFSGTSAASPIVAGLLALLKTAFSGQSNSTIVNRLLGGAENIDAENPQFVNQLGSGRINAVRSICLYAPQNLTLIEKNLAIQPDFNSAHNVITINSSTLTQGTLTTKTFVSGSQIRITGDINNPTIIDDHFQTFVIAEGLCEQGN